MRKYRLGPAVLSGGSLTPLRGCKKKLLVGAMPFMPHQRMQCSNHLGRPIRFSQRGWRCPTGFARILAAKEKEHGFHLFAIN